jgi:hypothetical protein
MNELHFGLCIGIDRYPGFPGRDLASASQDARAFRDWLIAPGGGALPEENVALVTVEADEAFAGVTDARPKMQEVVLALDSINERLRQHLAVNPEDWNKSRVYIYAAGHGIAIPNGEGAVLMADAKPQVLGFNIDLSQYADWYAHCGLVHDVIVFVDCCREVADGVPLGFVMFQQCRFPANKGSVRLVAYASRWGEQAWEPTTDPNLARGYFTQALLDGLNGAAEETGTRQVTAASLATYVAQAVEAKTQPPVAPYPQRAEMLIDAGVPLVLRGAPATAAQPDGASGAPVAPTGAVTSHTATIHFPAGFSGEVTVKSSDGMTHGRWRAAEGPWQLTLPDSFYQVVAEPPGSFAFGANGLFALVGSDADVRL